MTTSKRLRPRLVIGAAAAAAVVVTGVTLVFPAQAGRRDVGPRPPDNSGCRQEVVDSEWQAPTANPGTDIRVCRTMDQRIPRPVPTPNGGYLRTPDGRIRMFLNALPPAPGSPEAAMLGADAAAAADFLRSAPAKAQQTLEALGKVEAAANLPADVKAHIPTADSQESFARALRSGAMVEVEPLAPEEKPRP